MTRFGAAMLLASCEDASAAPLARGEQPQAHPQAQAQARQNVAGGESLTWIELRNVDLRFADRGAVRIRHLRGEMVRRTRDVPAALDDVASFSIRITDGLVSMSGEDLGALMNGYVFAYPGAPLSKLVVRTEGTRIVQSGMIHKGVNLPFEITASLSLTPEGLVRLHPERVRILGVDGAALLRALGLRLDDLLDLRRSHGASVKGNDIFLDPMKILPPPAIAGRLASIQVEGKAIVQRFVRLPDDSVFGGSVRPDTSVSNFVFFRGGQMRFGKLLMSGTDLQIDDADQSDPFDLYLKHYNEQLVAGYSRNQSDLGLTVKMPDFADLGRPVAPPVVPAGTAPTKP